MRLPQPLREALKRVVFGPENFPQQVPVGMYDPQSEVAVRLSGLGEPRDVTREHMMACGFPFTIGIALQAGTAVPLRNGASPSLSFHEKNGRDRLLGKIGLRLTTRVSVGSKELCLFHPSSSNNYCLPKPWLWSRYLYYARMRSSPQTAEMPLSVREGHSMFVFYICPRPVVLASIGEKNVGNIFPINLMGRVSETHFAFALNRERPVTSAVERSGRIAISAVPMAQCFVAMQLGKNHREQWIDWNLLPFKTRLSATLGLRVPDFALRIREMEIESVREVGSHKLFIARVVRDERREEGLEFFVVHGIYQASRERSRRRAA